MQSGGMMVKVAGMILLAIACLVASFFLLGYEVADKAAEEAISDINTGSIHPETIRGAELGVAGFIGEAERGPLVPQAITRYEDYERIFGGYTGRSYLPYAVKGYFENGGKKLYAVRVISGTAQVSSVKLKKGKNPALTVNAINAGEWGNRIALRISQGRNSTEESPTFMLEVFWFSHAYYSSVKPGKHDPSRADAAEVYYDLSIDASSPYYFDACLNGASNLITIEIGEGDEGVAPDSSDKLIWCEGGSDGEAPSLADFVGNDGLDGNPSTGLESLRRIDSISVLYSPLSGAVEGLDDKLISQCEELGDKTVIFDTMQGDMHPDPWSTHESSYAACYYPWVLVAGFDGKEILIPPGGLIAGTYARNDLVKGPNRAPVNEALLGVIGTERELSVQEQEALSLRRINPIVSRNGTDYFALGTDTMSDVVDRYRYINIRRYVNYLVNTFSDGMGWVTGAEWTEELKKEIKITIENFLDHEWKRGALIGDSQIQAYYVSVDRRPVAQKGFQRQAVVMEIGVALQKPSEFFTFTIIK